MSQAKSTLQAAEKAGAPDTDPVDIEFARSKYQQAQTAMTAGKNALAADLAHESMADSQLALTKARLATLRGQVRAQNTENARLRKQLLDRQAAARAATPPPSEPSTEELPETVLPSASSAPAPASSAAGTMQEGQ